ncbi:ATP-binding protein [Ampullimonas aquatilis]|uniref:ATP-binding protein n=1 Tax=Ampullimonas aquatilis TaxID=1341549 RepID=UPI003C76B3EE
MLKGFAFGKYREIILAIAFFIILDLSVLVLSFFISFQIANDAVSINLAGRQRMLTQRMTKSLLTLDSDLKQAKPAGSSLEELRNTSKLFGETLSAFQNGARVMGSNNREEFLPAIESSEGQQFLNQARDIWLPYQVILAKVTQAGFNATQLEEAITYSRANNLKLLALMNDLTSHLEMVAKDKADKLRLVQTIGIILALMNFFFILFKFLGRLQENDRKVDQARSEMAEILGTVKEGLFLLDREFKIGAQRSASLEHVFGQIIPQQADFIQLLSGRVDPSTLNATRDYIELLFGDRVKESLVKELNPLTQVVVQVPNLRGQMTTRYLAIQFSRVKHNDEVVHLLVTVQDVTAQVETAQTVETLKTRSTTGIDAIFELLNLGPVRLRQFIVSTESALSVVNQMLKSSDGQTASYRSQVDAIFRTVHTLKGEASSLGLSMFENLAQQFEAELQKIRGKNNVSGDDLLSLLVQLETFIVQTQSVKDLIERIDLHMSDAMVKRTQQTISQDEALNLKQDLQRLVTRAATDEGKKIGMAIDLDPFSQIPDKIRDSVRELAIQLVRNAVAHGIEPSGERLQHNKTEAGAVTVALKAVAPFEYELSVKDDGRGLSPKGIRASLIRSGRYTEAQLASLDDRSILKKIFDPGMSAAPAASKNSGFGVGMDIIKQKIQQMGAQLRITTKEQRYTQFSIRFSIQGQQ